MDLCIITGLTYHVMALLGLTKAFGLISLWAIQDVGLAAQSKHKQDL